MSEHYMQIEDNCCAWHARMLQNLGSRECLCLMNYWSAQ